MRSSDNAYVDLGLAILSAVTKPGQRRTTAEIAAYCGCSKQAISIIEQKALMKLRRAALDDANNVLWELFDEINEHAA